MKIHAISPFFILFACCFSACLPLQDNRLFPGEDMHPPLLVSAAPLSEVRLKVNFNEPPLAEAEDFIITPFLPVLEAEAEENSLVLNLGDSQIPGKEYILEGKVKDEHGNSLKFILSFYGYNPSIPDIVINEFITQGSSTHPDMVELAVLSEGNLAGLCLYEGTYSDWDEKKIFPDLAVVPGDFILVHFKPQGISEEMDETENRDVSGGLDASPDAYDFWVTEGGGLSGNNGVVSLYSSPGAYIIDGVLYSNRTSSSDETYRGFGSLTVLNRADELVEGGGWIVQGELAAPEDGINPDDSTATRSMCRSSSSDDADRKTDWHIVPTSTSSFGSVNSDELYSP